MLLQRFLRLSSFLFFFFFFLFFGSNLHYTVFQLTYSYFSLIILLLIPSSAFFISIIVLSISVCLFFKSSISVKHLLCLLGLCLHSFSKVLDHLYYHYSETIFQVGCLSPLYQLLLWVLPGSLICNLLLYHLFFFFFDSLCSRSPFYRRGSTPQLLEYKPSICFLAVFLIFGMPRTLSTPQRYSDTLYLVSPCHVVLTALLPNLVPGLFPTEHVSEFVIINIFTFACNCYTKQIEIIFCLTLSLWVPHFVSYFLITGRKI